MRTIELPATRGKITDRDGQVLASSLPVKAIWAIPDDVQKRPGQAETAGPLLEMSDAELRKKLDSDRSFVYLKRQVEQDVADRSPSWDRRHPDPQGIQALLPAGRSDHPRGGLHQRGRQGQESMELAQQKNVGQPGSRRDQGPPGPHRGRYRVGARAA
jgi:cell division protein FtsI (penicillin-binding protein 3)